MKQVILSAILSVAVLFAVPASADWYSYNDTNPLETGTDSTPTVSFGVAHVQMPDYCESPGVRFVNCEDNAIGYTASFGWHTEEGEHHWQEYHWHFGNEVASVNDDDVSPLSFGFAAGYTWAPSAFEVSGDDFSGDAVFHSAHANAFAHFRIMDALNVRGFGNLSLTGRVGAHYSKLDRKLSGARPSGLESIDWHQGYMFGGSLRWHWLYAGWQRRISDELGDVDIISVGFGGAL